MMMARALLNDESGLVISTELVLVVTLAFTAVAVGLAAARDALTQELNDVSEMVGTVDQSYNVSGIRKARNHGKYHATCSGFGFNDRSDQCDCEALEIVVVCGKTQNDSGVHENDDPTGP